MRKLLAIWLGKNLTIIGKKVGKKTTSSPGAYALKICPDLVKGLEKCVSKGIIVTCGTNGKTTTNNLMASALEAKGYKVICNKLGANMVWNIMGKTDENAYLLDMGWREMLDPLDPSKTIIYKGTKPEEYNLRNPVVTQDYTVSMSGGTDKGTYYASLG